MSDATPLGNEPADDAGEESIRLDADKTRDALEATLDDLESRLKPTNLAASLKVRFTQNPAPFIAVGVAVVGAIAGIVLLSARSRDARG